MFLRSTLTADKNNVFIVIIVIIINHHDRCHRFHYNRHNNVLEAVLFHFKMQILIFHPLAFEIPVFEHLV
jgi:hypothetical protein